MENYFQTILNARGKFETVKRVKHETEILAKRMSKYKTPVKKFWGTSTKSIKTNKFNVDNNIFIYKDG